MSNHLYPITQIATLIQAQPVFNAINASISNICTDSRTIFLPQHTLFIALNGRRNGHEYIDEAYELGIRNFVVNQDFRITHLWSDANFLKVPNTLSALQLLAQKHREKFNFPVIGITGSNGKTIVKEWIWQLLSNDFLIIKSPKSYNSQIGVPLSVWQMQDGQQLAIFEAGISTVREMQNLAAIIQPSIGILTNIGQAHAEGFSSTLEKLKEKLILFQNAEVFIYSPDALQGIAPAEIPGKIHFTWSFTQIADLQIIKIEKNIDYTLLTAQYQQKNIQISIPFTDDASMENAVICWALLLYLKYDMEDIALRLSHLHHLSMRLELKNGLQNCTIIDDSYSTDESSLAIALDFLAQQNQHPYRTLILSDILQSDKSESELYLHIAQLIHQKKINKLIGIGEKMCQYQDAFKAIEKHYFFRHTQQFIQHISELNFENESILIKGSRGFTFEKISKILTQKVHDTVLEINLNAIIHNLNYYKTKIGKAVKIMAMVKAFSYGSGTFEIANVLQYHKVDYLAVAYADEGVALRQAGISLPIMVMSPEFSAFENIFKHQLEPEIYSIAILKSFISALPNFIAEFPIHLKIDTGMHRLGFENEDIEELLHLLQAHPSLKIQSIFSHLSVSDDAKMDAYTHHQIQNFEQIAAQIEQNIGYSCLKHIANTAAIGRFPEAHLDMVRLGIGLYGFDAGQPNNQQLQTVACLKTTITQIKNIAANDAVGYGRRGLLPKGGKIATVKIGYADGFHRAFGNGVGALLVNGKLAYTVGNICMDMCMIDVTDIETFEGDEAIVFDEQLNINELAKAIHTIPYEILTNVSQRVKRVYFYD